MIFVDWVKARMQEAIWLNKSTLPRLAIRPRVLLLLKPDVRRVIAEGIQAGGFADAPAPVVTVPNVLNLDSATRASRELPDVTFTARFGWCNPEDHFRHCVGLIRRKEIMASTRTSTSPIDVSVVISHPATGMIHTDCWLR